MAYDVHPLVGLVSAWHLGEVATGFCRDYILLNHVAASGVSITTASGLGGENAVSLTRSNEDHLQVASNSSLQTGDADFTFLCAFRRASTGGTHIIASKDGSTREWQLSIGGTNLVAANVFRPTAVTATSTFGATSTGTWYVAALVHNAATDKLGVFVSNGSTHEYDEVDTGGALQAAGTAQFRIGSSQLIPTAAFDGLLQVPLFYKRAVSENDLGETASLIINEDVADWPWYRPVGLGGRGPGGRFRAVNDVAGFSRLGRI